MCKYREVWKYRVMGKYGKGGGGGGGGGDAGSSDIGDGKDV